MECTKSCFKKEPRAYYTSINIACPQEGCTALFQASQNGHCAVVNALLAARSNVNLYSKVSNCEVKYMYSVIANATFCKKTMLLNVKNLQVKIQVR